MKYNLEVQNKTKIELDTCVRLSGLTIDIFCNIILWSDILLFFTAENIILHN